MFFLSTVSLLLSINLFVTLRKPFPLVVLGFMVRLLVGELAPFILLIQVASTALIVACGGAITPLALIILATSWCLLLAYIIEAMHSTTTLSTQMDELYGISSAQAQTPFDLVPEGIDKDLVKRTLRPFSIRLPNVRCRRDLVYGQAGDTFLKLDLYTPREAVYEQAPVMMFIHGGGLLDGAGTKTGQGLPLINELCHRGWVVASIDYRLSPSSRWPAHLQDCKTALGWIHREIAEHGGNPGFVLVSGDSAGGQLAALMALTANQPRFQPGNEEQDTRVQGAICHYGVMDFGNLHDCQHNPAITSLWLTRVMGENSKFDVESASPITATRADELDPATIPPCLVLHGDRDNMVAVAESRLFARKLIDCSPEPVIYAELRGAEHGYNMFRSLRSELALRQCARFAEWLYERHQKPG